MRCFKCSKEIRENEKIVSGLHIACFLKWFHMDEVEDFHDVIAQSTEKHEDEFSEITSSFYQGKFKKYSAHLGEKSYILKVKEDRFPELPATEYLCNQLANQLGLQVPNNYPRISS